MAKVFGKEYTRRALQARVGSMKQIADARCATLNDGREAGTEIIEITAGGLSATVAPGRCMDITNLSWKGTPLNFTGKNGIVYAGFADPANNPLRSVNGGMFYTCGLTNVGGGYGDDYFHGRIRLIPAEQAYASADWEGEEYVLRCGGTMRQNGVCYENLRLTRVVETALGSKEITVRDTVSNDGFSASPFMMMYHVVFGFPLLDANARIYAAAKMDENACRCAAPTPQGDDNGGGLFPVLADKDGNSVYCLYNPDLSLGLAVTFSAKVMPYLSQWKSMQSGDYAMGLMPANCHGAGRQAEIDQGTLRFLAPDETVHSFLTFTVLEGEEDLAEIKERIAQCVYPA